MQNFQAHLDTHKDGFVQLTRKVSFRQSDIIEDNYLDIAARFEVPTFSDGRPKEKFDIGRILSTRLKACTDIDTKDLQIHAENQATIPLSGLLKGALRHRLKVDDYGTLFNDVRDELIEHGHVIIKKVGGSTEIVDLRNVIRPAHIMDLQKGGITERTYLTWDQMMEHKEEWKKNWSEIEALYEKMKNEHKHFFIVHEHWCMDKFEGKITKGCIKYLDRSLSAPDKMTDEWDPQLELDRFETPEKAKIRNKRRLKNLRKSGYIGQDEDEEPVYPYEEERFLKIKGRWLGVGVREVCRPLQKAYDRNMNNKLRFDEIAHKGVSVHTKVSSSEKGKGLTQAAINALEYGGVVSLKQGEGLTRLQFGSLIGDFLATADKFLELARMMLGITAQAAGDEQVASQSATAAAIDQNVSKTTYDLVIEQQSLLWKRYFAKFELKSILEDITEEEWSKIEGDPIDLEDLERPFIENLINTAIPQAVQQGSFVPESSQLPPEEHEMIVESVHMERRKMNNIRFAQLVKDIIKEADFFIEFFVNNESFDKIEKIKALRAMAAEAKMDPASDLSPNKLNEAALELMDLSGKRFKRTEQEKQALLETLQQSQMPQPQPVM